MSILSLEGLAGDDQFVIAPQHAGRPGHDQREPRSSPASDEVVILGTTDPDVFQFRPTSSDAGSVLLVGAAIVNFTTTELVRIDGQGRRIGWR